MSELKEWNLQRVQSVLVKAHEAVDSAKTGADRILRFPDVTSACDWLVAQRFKDKRTVAKLVTLAHGVINETKLFPPSGDPTGSKHYSIAHLGRFDEAIRALKDFVDKLAARAAKE